MYEIYLDRWLLPLAPQEIKIRTENKNETIMLINEGEYNILKKEGLKKVSFEFVLPAYQYPFGNYTLGFKNPKDYIAKLE